MRRSKLFLIAVSMLFLVSLSSFVVAVCDTGKVEVSKTCGDGVCTSDTGTICCEDPSPNTNQGDCVSGDTCYNYYDSMNCGSSGACVDVDDASDDLEVCMAYNTWRDPDDYTSACKAVNNTNGLTMWMKNSPVCGLSETGEGSCDDVAQDISEFCCGDDENELNREGYPTVCFAEEEDCYYDGQYYVDEEYMGDNYCEDGNITSRTKFIALQLIDIAEELSEDDYTLFCDSYEDVLNYYDYVLEGYTISSYFTAGYGGSSAECTDSVGDGIPCVNNICVLRLPEDELSHRVIFGASLNKLINEGNYKFLIALGEDDDRCNDAIGCDDCDDGKFHACNAAFSEIWYNEKLESVIFSKDVLLYDAFGTLNVWEKFLLFLRNPFKRIFDFLFKLITETTTYQEDLYGFIEDTQKFSRLYLDKKGLKTIRAFAEATISPTQGEHLSATYSCFKGNICDTVNMSYDKMRNEGLLSSKDLVLCGYNDTIGTYYVSSNSTAGLDLWLDLTAKIRTIDTGVYPETKPMPHLSGPETAKVSEEIEFKVEVEGCETPYDYTIYFADNTERDGEGNLLFYVQKAYGAEGTYEVQIDVEEKGNANDWGRDFFTIEILPAIGRLTCGIYDAGVCESEYGGTVLFKVSDMDNAHAELESENNYAYEVCCALDGGELDVDNSGDDNQFIISLSEDTNAHADINGDYDNDLYLSSPNTGVYCRNTLGCLSSEACLFSVPSSTNAHVLGCGGSDAYTDICCGLSGERCEVKTACDEVNEVCVFALSGDGDAHVSLDCGGDAFGYKLCCPSIYAVDDTCSQAGLVSLSSTEDAHVSLYDFNEISSFENDVCVKSAYESEKAVCRATTGDCDFDELCFASLLEGDDTNKGTENTHLSECGSDYAVDICCKVSKDAVEDCFVSGDEDGDGLEDCADVDDCPEGTYCDIGKTCDQNLACVEIG